MGIPKFKAMKWLKNVKKKQVIGHDQSVDFQGLSH